MKIIALLVVKAPVIEGGKSFILAKVLDLSHFGFFYCQYAKEFILFASRTIMGKTSFGQRQSIKEDGKCLVVFGLFL